MAFFGPFKSKKETILTSLMYLGKVMIKVSPTSIELKPGETAEVTVNMDDKYLDNFKFEWFRYSPNIPHGKLVG